MNTTTLLSTDRADFIMVLIEIHLSHKELSPPIYLAGTFSEWQPTIEMEHSVLHDGVQMHYDFRKVLDLSPGEHQYKFRLGNGDWWITDEKTATVCDNAGNTNNKIVVDEVESPAFYSPSKVASIRIKEIRAESFNSSLRSVKSFPLTSSPTPVTAATPSSTEELVTDHTITQARDRTVPDTDGGKDCPASMSQPMTANEKSNISRFFNQLLCCSAQ